MATLLKDLQVDEFGFSSKVAVSDTTGSRNIYMSIDRSAGFSKAQNLNIQICTPDSPLHVLYDISEPKQGNASRWGLDVEVPVGSSLYTFLDSLNKRVRTEISERAAECFPSLKVDKMSDDQLNMCLYPLFKPAEDGGTTGRLKVKIIMPPTEEELSRMTKPEAERRVAETTKVHEVNSWEAPSEKNSDGLFEHTVSDVSLLKGGCKVMPIIGTTGIWMNKSNCGVSFVCTSICVWKAPETAGIGMFNLGGVTTAGVKRKYKDNDEAYLPYNEEQSP